MAESLVEAVAGTPSPPLRSAIGRYRGYRMAGPPGTHRGLPSRHLTFIISLAEPVDIARMPEDTQAPGRFQAFVGGPHASPASIRHEGFQYGISVELTPLGARALLGLPAGELAYAVVPPEDVLGPGAIGLVDRLAAAPGWRERLSVLDEALVPPRSGGGRGLERLLRPSPSQPRVAGDRRVHPDDMDGRGAPIHTSRSRRPRGMLRSWKPQVPRQSGLPCGARTPRA